VRERVEIEEGSLDCVTRRAKMRREEEASVHFARDDRFTVEEGHEKKPQAWPHSKLAAGNGYQMALCPNAAGCGGELPIAGVHGLREGEKRRGVDGGDGTPVGESHGNLRRSDVFRKLDDGKEIEASCGEKRSVDGATELLDGSANHRETVLWGVGQVIPGLSGEANLEAIVGHCSLVSGGGLNGRHFNPAPL